MRVHHDEGVANRIDGATTRIVLPSRCEACVLAFCFTAYSMPIGSRCPSSYRRRPTISRDGGLPMNKGEISLTSPLWHLLTSMTSAT